MQTGRTLTTHQHANKWQRRMFLDLTTNTLTHLSHTHSHINIYVLAWSWSFGMCFLMQVRSSSDHLYSSHKNKMNWGDKDHRQEQKQMLPLEMHNGAKTDKDDYTKEHLEGVVTFNISFSTSPQDGYSSNKLRDNIYPALEKWSFHTLSVLCLPHMFMTHR